MATTSGTVSQTPFTIRKVIDHAARRAGFVPERVSGEALSVAMDLLFTITSEWVNAGFPLWTQGFSLGAITMGSPEIQTPVGTVDVLHAFWRILNPYRGPATLTTGLDATALLAGQPNADVTITGPNPGIVVNFTTDTEVDTVGVLPGGTTTSTVALQVYGSADGVTYALLQTLPSATYTPGTWVYFDLDPFLTLQYIQIVNPTSGSWTVNQFNLGLANGQDIEAGLLSIDDYYQLPNKQFSDDRVISVYIDRQVQTPVLKGWPTPNVNAFYNGTMSLLTRRYIQDPGQMTNNLEIPQRWFEATIWRLATRLAVELPDDLRPEAQQQMTYFTMQARQQTLQYLEQQATKAEALVWGEERTRGPIRLHACIAPYTK
jgi:hypothetical protein